jgi:hypothetical protein
MAAAAVCKPIRQPDASGPDNVRTPLVIGARSECWARFRTGAPGNIASSTARSVSQPDLSANRVTAGPPSIGSSASRRRFSRRRACERTKEERAPARRRGGAIAPGILRRGHVQDRPFNALRAVRRLCTVSGFRENRWVCRRRATACMWICRRGVSAMVSPCIRVVATRGAREQNLSRQDQVDSNCLGMKAVVFSILPHWAVQSVISIVAS